MLEAEGHVLYAPHRGYRVVELAVDDLRTRSTTFAPCSRTRPSPGAAIRIAGGRRELVSVRAAVAETRDRSSPTPTADPRGLAAGAIARSTAAVVRPTPPRRRGSSRPALGRLGRLRARCTSPSRATRPRRARAHAVMAASSAATPTPWSAVLAEHRAGALSALRHRSSSTEAAPAARLARRECLCSSGASTSRTRDVLDRATAPPRAGRRRCRASCGAGSCRTGSSAAPGTMTTSLSAATGPICVADRGDDLARAARRGRRRRRP